MSAPTSAAAVAAVKPAIKKRAGAASKAKKPADHPKYSDMVKAALGALKVRSVGYVAHDLPLCDIGTISRFTNVTATSKLCLMFKTR